jgi:hypothetical protein
MEHDAFARDAMCTEIFFTTNRKARRDHPLDSLNWPVREGRRRFALPLVSAEVEVPALSSGAARAVGRRQVAASVEPSVVAEEERTASAYCDFGGLGIVVRSSWATFQYRVHPLECPQGRDVVGRGKSIRGERVSRSSHILL